MPFTKRKGEGTYTEDDMKLFRFRSSSTPASAASEPSGPANSRCYAIGDIHGCLDQLSKLLEQIARDNAARPPVERLYILTVGDLIDRGPDSKGVVDLLMARPLPSATFVFLTGNHEELFLQILDGDDSALPHWLEFGGFECAVSYGADPDRLVGRDGGDELRASVPAHHVAFLRSFGDGFRFGDYLFVHAGIRPGRAVDQQRVADMRWIRREFLESADDHGAMIVHGHTISEEPVERPNRIGIDTGAYASGRLTAIGLEGKERWFLHADGEPAHYGDGLAAALARRGGDG